MLLTQIVILRLALNDITGVLSNILLPKLN